MSKKPTPPVNVTPERLKSGGSDGSSQGPDIYIDDDGKGVQAAIALYKRQLSVKLRS